MNDTTPPGRAPANRRVADRVTSFASGGDEAWAVHSAAQKKRHAGEDVILLTIGDPDFDTPDEIVDAAIASLRRGETHYTPAAGIPEFGKAIAAYETKRIGRTFTPKNVVATQGAQNGLYAIMQCLVNPGEEVISTDPAYPTFSGVVGGAGAVMKRAPLAVNDGEVQFALSAYEKELTDKTRAILVNFPHNPTGAVMSDRQAREILSFARANNLWLICDEVYAEMCFEAPYCSPMTLAGAEDCTVCVRSLSKSHAMAGWRVGWLLANEDLCGHLQNLVNCMLFGGAAFIQHGAAVGLSLDAAADMARAYRRRRDLVLAELKGLNRIRPLKPQSGIFMLIDVRPTGLSADEFAWGLLDKKNVAVMPADSFSPLTEGFVRISLCEPDDELAEACRRMAHYARQLDQPDQNRNG